MYQLILNEKRGKIRELPELPAFPLLAQEILHLVTNENVDIPRLAKTIEQDVSVFGRIIGVANSAYFGSPDHIYTVTHAIVRVLGLSMVKSISLGIVLNEPFKVGSCKGFDMQQYWFHSMLTACVAQRLCRYVKIGQANFQDHAYLAGMLHNIGELILVHLYPSEMQDVYTQLQHHPDANKLELENEIVGINSHEASSILSQRWHLPEDLRVVYEHYDELDYDGEHWQLQQLILLCGALIEAGDTEGLMDTDDVSKIMSRLCLTRGQINKLLHKISNDRQDVEKLALILARA